MSYHVSITTAFITKTEEQAEYIRKFFVDAESLMTCESSSFLTSQITETDEVDPRLVINYNHVAMPQIG